MPHFSIGKFIKFWFPVVVYSAIIFTVSSWPQVEVPPVIPFADKVAHLIEYTGLGFLFARALGASLNVWPRKKLILATILFACLYGASDEFHQYFIPGRTVGIDDWLADTVGGLLGSIIYFNTKKETNNGSCKTV